jgi:hypothetical protein
LDSANRKLEVRQLLQCDRGFKSYEDLAFTVFAARDGLAGRDAQLTRNREARSVTAPVERLHPQEANLPKTEGWLVKTTKTVRLAPQAKQMLVDRLEVPKYRENPQPVPIEPVQLPFEGIHFFFIVS